MSKLFLFAFLFLALFLPLHQAQALQLNLDYPGLFGIDINNSEHQGIPQVVAWFYYLIVSVSGLAAFAMLVVGGLQWLGSAGNISAISDAKDRIQKAIFGLIIVLSSFLIIQLINPAGTGVFSIDLEEVSVPTTSGAITDSAGDSALPGDHDSDSPQGNPYSNGVFLCKNENCSGGVTSGEGDAIHLPADSLEDPSAQNCVAVLPGDPVVIEYSNVRNCVPNVGSSTWGIKTKALGIKGVSEYDVVLFSEGAQGFDRALCLTNGSARLDDFKIGPSDGWNKKTTKVWITENGFCKIPGLTVGPGVFRTEEGKPLTLDFPQPSVFLFEEKDFGETSSVKYGAPTSYLYSIWSDVTGGSPVQIRASSLLIDKSRVDSALIIKDNPDTSEDEENRGVAVRIFGPNGQNICFTSSQRNLDLESYAFSDGKIGDSVRQLQLMLERDCEAPGVMQRP
jgi:hypothetical protein